MSEQSWEVERHEDGSYTTRKITEKSDGSRKTVERDYDINRGFEPFGGPKIVREKVTREKP